MDKEFCKILLRDLIIAKESVLNEMDCIEDRDVFLKLSDSVDILQDILEKKTRPGVQNA